MTDPGLLAELPGYEGWSQHLRDLAEEAELSHALLKFSGGSVDILRDVLH